MHVWIPVEGLYHRVAIERSGPHPEIDLAGSHLDIESEARHERARSTFAIPNICAAFSAGVAVREYSIMRLSMSACVSEPGGSTFVTVQPNRAPESVERIVQRDAASCEVTRIPRRERQATCRRGRRDQHVGL